MPCQPVICWHPSISQRCSWPYFFLARQREQDVATVAAIFVMRLKGDGADGQDHFEKASRHSSRSRDCDWLIAEEIIPGVKPADLSLDFGRLSVEWLMLLPVEEPCEYSEP